MISRKLMPTGHHHLRFGRFVHSQIRDFSFSPPHLNLIKNLFNSLTQGSSSKPTPALKLRVCEIEEKNQGSEVLDTLLLESAGKDSSDALEMIRDIPNFQTHRDKIDYLLKEKPCVEMIPLLKDLNFRVAEKMEIVKEWIHKNQEFVYQHIGSLSLPPEEKDEILKLILINFSLSGIPLSTIIQRIHKSFYGTYSERMEGFIRDHVFNTFQKGIKEGKFENVDSLIRIILGQRFDIRSIVNLIRSVVIIMEDLDLTELETMVTAHLRLKNNRPPYSDKDIQYWQREISEIRALAKKRAQEKAVAQPKEVSSNESVPSAIIKK